MIAGGRVVVVGSVNVDLVATAEQLPRPGETVTGATFAEHDGGKGANQAVAAARLGAPTAFVGAVGRDPFGMRARAALEREGIDLTGLRTTDGPTGVALIVVDAHGENLIAVASGANARVTPADVADAFDRLRPARGDVLLVGHEIATETATAALRAGRAAAATTVLNPAPAAGIDRAVFGLADILTVNELELAAILAADEAADVDALLRDRGGAPGVRAGVVLTRGAAGATLVLRDRPPMGVPAHPVIAVDAVGAGDTFAGALAAGLAGRLGAEESVRRAVVAASLSTTRPGARAGMPTAAEVDGVLGH